MSRLQTRFAIWLALAALAAAGPACSTASNRQASLTHFAAAAENTNDGWETAPLGSETLNPRLIDELFQRIADGTYPNLHSLLIVRGEQLIVEAYYPGRHPLIGPTLEQEPDWEGTYQDFDRDTLHTLQSATKSIASILVGIAIDRGLISSADEKASTFFPELSGKDDLRLKHLLDMTAGLEWNENVPLNDPRNDVERMNHSADPIALLVRRPLVETPGTRFNYNSAASVALGEIVARASGMSVEQFARIYLFEPLGIEQVAWVGRFPSGTVHTGGGLYLRPRDMARIGCMMLNEGRWKGRQIVSEAWVRQSTARQAPDQNYGYQWWRRSFDISGRRIDCFYAGGYGGQYILVCPRLRLVAVSTGWNPDRPEYFMEMVQRYVLPAAW